MRNENSKYSVYALHPRLHPQVFGEVYLIATAIESSENTFDGEAYLLIERPEPRMDMVRFSFPRDPEIEADLGIDIDFILNEARLRGDAMFAGKLSARADELSRPEILGFPICFEVCSYGPFVSCWARGKFKEQIQDVASSTLCAPLGKHLDIVRSVKLFSGLGQIDW